MLDKLTLFATFVLTLSLAVERVTEILKRFIEKLLPETEAYRTAILHVLAAVVGTAIATQVPEQVGAAFGLAGDRVNAGLYILVGIVASGGSTMWNQILDMLHAAKVGKEDKAGLRPAQLKAKAASLGK